MNFTSFDQSSLVFARNWWIFLAVAIPMTLLTMLAVGIAMLKETRKREGRPQFEFRKLLQRRKVSDSSLPFNEKGK